MAPKIQNKRSSTASNPPTDTQLDPGEIALNTNATTANLHFKDAGNTVRSIGADPTAAGTYVRNVAGANAVGTWVPASDGVVDLDYTPAATEGTVTNTAGTDATLPFATSAEAGLFIEAATPGSGTVQYARQVTDAGAASWAQVAIPPGTIVGPDADRPASPDDGQTFYNTDNSTLWVWDNDNSTWAPAMVPVPTGGGEDYTTATLNERCFFNNEQTIDNDYTVTSTTNSLSAGPITVDAAATVTVADGGTWTVVGGAGQQIDPAGFWTRSGTTLSPANDGDNVEIGSGNIELNANGSAIFESFVVSNNRFDARNSQIGQSTFTGRNSGASGTPITFQALTEGTIRIGNDLNNEEPNITLDADGSASFGGEGAGRKLTVRDQNTAAFIGQPADGDANDMVTIQCGRNSGDTSTRYINFRRQDGTIVGYVGMNGASAVTFSQNASDYRLKENVVPLPDSIERLKTLRPVRFNFIASPDEIFDGFIAHECTDIPKAVIGEKDAVNENGEIQPQGLDVTRIIPVLTDALQKALTRIEALEAKLNTLEGGTATADITDGGNN